MLREKKIAVAIVVAYMCFLPLGAFLSYKFLQNTKMIYVAPEGSLVQRSEVSAHINFENQIGYKPMWILVQSTDASQSIISNNDFFVYCEFFNRSTHPGGELFGEVTFIEGYYFVPDVPQLRDQLIGGPNNDSTVLNINVADATDYDAFASSFQAFNNRWLAANNVTSFSLAYTGVDLISKDLESGILGDLAIIDAISMPLAFAALAYCLSSFRLLLVPLMTVPCTLTLAFSIMYPVSFATDVSSFAPEMAAACMMAISIDYALFILSRFVEQCGMQHAKFGRSADTEWLIIKNTTVLSAHNILISGLTIAVALGGLSFLPISFLSTIGMTMSCGAVSAVFVSMSLMPSLLFVFFGFFSRCDDFTRLVKRFRRWRAGGTGKELDDDRSESSSLLATPKQDDMTEYQLRQYNEQSSSVWFKVGLVAYRHPVITVLAVLAMGAPFFYFASQIRVDFDLFNQVPRDSEHAAVLKKIVAEIGRGSAAPYYLTFSSNDPNITVWNDERFFTLINDMTKAISAKTGQPLDRILSPCLLPPSNLTGGQYLWLTSTLSFAFYESEPDYRYLFDRTVSAKRTAALVSMYTVFDPFSWQSDSFLDSIRDIINEFQAQQGGWVFIGVLGASADSWSIMSHAMALFPYQICITFSVIFVFIAVVFRSAFVPFRMVFTVAYTIGMSYGAGVIMFQYTWLHKIWPALDSVNSYTWTVPIFSFSLLSALALDYDVFLLTRILEFKKMGYNDEAAISKAVWKTGRIISFAGVIMFISFGSLVFSNCTMLNQFGAIAGFAVAIDTFIIRPFFAPALMSIFPKWAWWPRKFSELERTIDDMRGDLGPMSPLDTHQHHAQQQSPYMVVSASNNRLAL